MRFIMMLRAPAAAAKLQGRALPGVRLRDHSSEFEGAGYRFGREVPAARMRCD